MIDLRNPTTGAPMTAAERVRWYRGKVECAELGVIAALDGFKRERSAVGWAILKLEIRDWRKLEAEARSAWRDFCAQNMMEKAA